MRNTPLIKKTTVLLSVALFASFLMAASSVSANGTTILPTSASGGTGVVADLKANDSKAYEVAKSAVATIGGFGAYGGGTITSVYLIGEYSVDAGYDGPNAIQVNGVDTLIVPANGDVARWFTLELDPAVDITNLTIGFTNNDGAQGDSVHFNYVNVLVNPTLPITMPPVLGEFVDFETPQGSLPVADSGATTWELTFSDEFNGTSLDTTKWGIDVSTKSRNPRASQGIADWWWKSENVTIDGSGFVELHVTKFDSDTMHCGSISSDGLYEPKYGYLEARIKIADTTKSTHTAFWLQGPNMNNSDPADGTANDGAEVDIFESAWFGDYTKSVVHIDGYDSDHRANTQRYDTPGLHSGYHVFGLEWTADSMKIYYDGVLKVTYTGSWVPQVQEWLWLSVGASFGDVGSFASAPVGWLSSAEVDYVRVWQALPNDAPVFMSNPFSAAAATKGLAYSGTIAGSATDTNGDPLMYAKAGGPAWLSIAGDGTLSGTPTNSDVGANAFTVSVNDSKGGSDTATLNITVDAGAPNNAPVVDAGSDQAVSLAEGPWSPEHLATTLWLDADDATTITESGGSVSQWADKSGYGNHASQSTGANQPATGGVINGRNAIDFNPGGTTQHLTTNLEQLTTVSIYLVIDPTARGVDGYSAAIGASAAGYGTNSGLFWPIEQWADGTERNDVYYTDNLLDKVFCNGVEDSADHNFQPVILSHQGTDLPTANLNYLLGNRSADLSESFAYKGLIGEIIICPEEHDLATRQKVEGYLAHKWGLTANLPDGHLYKTVAPMGDSAEATLNGAASDPDGDPYSTLWSLVSGPGNVTFRNTSAVDTMATFTALGTYVLELTADDDADQATDQVTITVVYGYNTWADSHGLSVVDAAPGSILQPDGLANLQKFAFGMDPSIVNFNQVEFVVGGEVTAAGSPALIDFAQPEQAADERAVFVRLKNYAAAGLTYIVDFSADLQEWTASNVTPTVLTSESSSGDLEVVSVPFLDTVPVAGGGDPRAPEFMRVAVSDE